MIPLIRANLRHLGATRRIIEYVDSTYYLMNSITIEILNTIAEVVCEYYKEPIDVIFEKSRDRDIVKIRQICHYLGKKYVRSSLRVIGLHLGNKDHATVLHSHRAVENDSRFDPLKTELMEIEKILKHRFLHQKPLNNGGEE